MRKSFEIGDKLYVSKKDALTHYKRILNSYDFGEILNNEDYLDVIELLETHPKVKEKIGVGIDFIRIAKVKYSTKSFELVRFDNSTEYFSYTKRINSPKTEFTKFREACRQVIQDDLRNVKQSYFDKYSKKGQVKCQESGDLLKWEDLSVDHRQPNTFSVIIDRFIELNNINLNNVKYIQIGGDMDEIEDEELKEKFRKYHSDKANLRIIKKELNIGRSFQARIIRQKKDLIIIDDK